MLLTILVLNWSGLEYSLKVKVLDSVSVESSSGILGVSENNCDCNSFQSMGLPCRHILAICKYNNRSQFLPEIIHQRWNLEYYQSGFKTPLTVTPRRPTIVNIRPTPKRIQPNDKYNTSMALFKQMASHLAKLGTSDFENKLAECVKMFDNWKSGNHPVEQTTGSESLDLALSPINEDPDEPAEQPCESLDRSLSVSWLLYSSDEDPNDDHVERTTADEPITESVSLNYYLCFKRGAVQ